MAFSATIRGARYLGPSGVQLFGDWTGTAGDAAGTMTVGGQVQNAVFQKFDAIDQTYQIIPRIETSFSSTTNLTTITIENQDTVTAGKFIIDKLSN